LRRASLAALYIPALNGGVFRAARIKSPFNEEQRRMLQALLRDRFQLGFHRTSSIGPVYVLLKGTGKLNMQPAKDQRESPWVGSKQGGVISGDGIEGKNISIPLLSSRLSRFLKCPVLDETGLDGSFDFQYDYVGDDSSDNYVASILTSVQGIGLKLKAGKGPIDTIIIDDAQKPSEN
jgi:uncharacterized protein (TIGR03435 family)